MVPGHHQKGKVRYKVKSGVEDVKPGTSYRQIFDKLRSCYVGNSERVKCPVLS